MDRLINTDLKVTFLIHAIVGVVLGLTYMLIPVTAGNWLGIEMSDPAYRAIGAVVTALGFSSILAFQAERWSEVRIVVLMEMVWTLLGALVTLWAVLSGHWPAAAWINFGLLAAFFLAFGWGYLRQGSAAVIKTA